MTRHRCDIRRALIAGASVVLSLGACAPQLHVPESQAGDVPVKLVNDAGQTLCEVRFSQPGQRGENIVKGGGFFAKTEGSVRLKAGAYDVEAVTCSDPISGASRVNVTQPTEIHIGGTSKPVAASGYVAAVVPLAIERASCSYGGIRCDAAAQNKPCCPGTHCQQDTDSRGRATLTKTCVPD